MGRFLAMRLVMSLALVGAVGTSALASCGIWTALAPAHRACCPDASDGYDAGAVLSGTCCEPAPEPLAPGTVTTSLPGPDLQVSTPCVVGSLADVRSAAYRAALPLAARGHAFTPVSALLI